MSKTPREVTGMVLPETQLKPTPSQQRSLALVRDLTDASATLVVKVATCKCDKKDSCKIYLQAQRIANIIDQLQETKVEQEDRGKVSGQGRRVVRAPKDRN